MREFVLNHNTQIKRNGIFEMINGLGDRSPMRMTAW